jgi:hypothetical protein
MTNTLAYLHSVIKRQIRLKCWFRKGPFGKIHCLQVWLRRLARDKHSSLFILIVTDEETKLAKVSPWKALATRYFVDKYG